MTVNDICELVPDRVRTRKPDVDIDRVNRFLFNVTQLVFDRFEEISHPVDGPFLHSIIDLLVRDDLTVRDEFILATYLNTITSRRSGKR
jgi:hypothetical protein